MNNNWKTKTLTLGHNSIIQNKQNDTYLKKSFIGKD